MSFSSVFQAPSTNTYWGEYSCLLPPKIWKATSAIWLHGAIVRTLGLVRTSVPTAELPVTAPEFSKAVNVTLAVDWPGLATASPVKRLSVFTMRGK